MSDFLKYWDTRIDANERFFNNYPHIANFAFSECQKLWDRMEEKNKALLTRHNALRYNTKVIIKAYRENRTRHNALVEAVGKVVEMHRKGEGHVCTHYPSGRRALDALAALVGEVEG